MKFFFYKNKTLFFNTVQNNNKLTTSCGNGGVQKTTVIKSKFLSNADILENFNGVLCKCGLSSKSGYFIINAFRQINFFFYKNKNYLYSNHTNSSWVFDNFFEKKINYQYLFNDLVDLLKPPFIIKSLLISKKLKKKLKIKYIVKIVYKKDDRRLKSSLKQIYYNNNSYQDVKFTIRLYKTLLFSLLD